MKNTFYNNCVTAKPKSEIILDEDLTTSNLVESSTKNLGVTSFAIDDIREAMTLH